jgi:hypothetical protein
MPINLDLNKIFNLKTVICIIVLIITITFSVIVIGKSYNKIEFGGIKLEKVEEKESTPTVQQAPQFNQRRQPNFRSPNPPKKRDRSE